MMHHCLYLVSIIFALLVDVSANANDIERAWIAHKGAVAKKCMERHPDDFMRRASCLDEEKEKFENERRAQSAQQPAQQPAQQHLESETKDSKKGTSTNSNPFDLDSVKPQDSQECIDINPGSVTQWSIVAKISSNSYEMVGRTCFGYRCSEPRRGILITLSKRFFQPGIVNVPMKEIGSKYLPTTNGFSSLYSYWQECAYEGDLDDIEISISEPGGGAAETASLTIVKGEREIELVASNRKFRLKVANVNKGKVRDGLNKALQYLKLANESYNRTYNKMPEKKFTIDGLGKVSVTGKVEEFGGNGDRYQFTTYLVSQGESEPRWVVIREDHLEKIVRKLNDK